MLRVESRDIDTPADLELEVDSCDQLDDQELVVDEPDPRGCRRGARHFAGDVYRRQLVELVHQVAGQLIQGVMARAAATDRVVGVDQEESCHDIYLPGTERRMQGLATSQ